MTLAQVVSDVDVIPAVGFMASIYITLRWFKLVSAKDWNGAATQFAAWVVGIAFAFVWAQTAWAEHINFQGIPLADLNGWSLVIAGFAAGSTASLGYVALKAFDNNQTAAEPSLFK